MLQIQRLISLGCLFATLLISNSVASAQTVLNAGAFQVEFWNQGDDGGSGANLGYKTVADGDLGTWSAAEQQAIIRAF
ncbi:hypothetical protein OAK91_07240, partial [Planctomycetaceae bacterium]|nr:hypothetical protein [Planctomycetaceae bacterium]